MSKTYMRLKGVRHLKIATTEDFCLKTNPVTALTTGRTTPTQTTAAQRSNVSTEGILHLLHQQLHSAVFVHLATSEFTVKQVCSFLQSPVKPITVTTFIPHSNLYKQSSSSSFTLVYVNLFSNYYGGLVYSQFQNVRA